MRLFNIPTLTTHDTLPARKLLFLLAVVVQLLSMPYLWGHASTGDAFLGRYSARYGVALLACVCVACAWLIAFLQQAKLSKIIERRKPLMFGGLCVILVACIGLQFVTVIAVVLRHFAALNGLLLLAIGLTFIPDAAVKRRIWLGLLSVSAIGISGLSLITALTALPYSPDEAHWADFASTPYVSDGLYSRTWRDDPVLVRPGLGWSVAVYGWVLENITFDMRVGRLWEFGMNLLISLGAAIVAYQLSGRAAALLAFCIALCTTVFVSLDYRPDTQVVPIGLLCIVIVLHTRTQQKPLHAWHFIAGFAVTFAMQLHAISIVYAFAISAYYAFDLFSALQQRNTHLLRRTLTYGIGATLGTALVFAFNILPVGLDYYLAELTSTRLSPERELNMLRWPLLQGLLVALGVAYLLWRRRAADRIFLSLLLLIFLGSLIFDTQGYSIQYQALLLPPAAVMLIDAWRTKSIKTGVNRRAVWLSACVLLMLGTGYAAEHVHWSGVQHLLTSGRLPEPENHVLAHSVEPHIKPGDVIASTHELIWALHDHTGLVSFAAEQNRQRYAPTEDLADVWRELQPTVVVAIPRRIVMPPGMQSYLIEANFQRCTSYTVIGIGVTILRPDCSVAPAASLAPDG